MIVVKLMGGLGNQMFQYAAGLRLAMHHQTELKLDLEFLQDRTPRENFTYRDFDLIVFDIPEKKASVREIRRFRRLLLQRRRSVIERLTDKVIGRHYYREVQSRGLDEKVFNLPEETYLEGYFQDERYFLDFEVEIRRRFALARDETKLPAGTRRLAEEIRSDGGICLHVRRGDYVTDQVTGQYHGCCGLNYYKTALKKLRSMGSAGPVFVFSDDQDWCAENFLEAEGFRVVGDEHSGIRASGHLWLMTLCRHFVISNSSFSWWAAWLGERPNTIVIRPSRWFQAAHLQDVTVCPPRWMAVQGE